LTGAPACNEAPGRRRRRARVRRGARVHARYTRLPDGQVPGRGSSTRCQFLKVPRKFAAQQDDRTQQHKSSEMQVSNCRLRPTTSNALSKVEKSTGVHTRPRREYSGLPTSNCGTPAGARARGRPGRRATGSSPNRLHVLTLQGAPAPLRLPARRRPRGPPATPALLKTRAAPRGRATLGPRRPRPSRAPSARARQQRTRGKSAPKPTCSPATTGRRARAPLGTARARAAGASERARLGGRRGLRARGRRA